LSFFLSFDDDPGGDGLLDLVFAGVAGEGSAGAETPCEDNGGCDFDAFCNDDLESMEGVGDGFVMPRDEEEDVAAAVGDVGR
jgi:hypothetical protein